MVSGCKTLAPLTYTYIYTGGVYLATLGKQWAVSAGAANCMLWHFVP